MTVPTFRCNDLRMRYAGQDDYALGDAMAGVSLEAQDGELLALLGPSGCGKTTTLRIIGGFIEPTSGTVEIRGRDVTESPPYARDANTVFQSYALFPHLDVAGNVGFGLKMEGVSRGERQRRVEEALQLVGLNKMGKRKVSELSGGQQQRAALARAIIKRPAVLLLDEPLGALDLKLRRQMQNELVQLKESTGVTFVHVTHDQEEACAIADRIAVMKQGGIVQVASPRELYRSPRTAYVASFIDAGTLVRGEVKHRGNTVEISNPDLTIMGAATEALPATGNVAAVIPPGEVRLKAAHGPPAAGSYLGVIDRCLFTGRDLDVYVRLGAATEVHAVMPRSDSAGLPGEEVAPGRRVEVSWSPESVVFVDDE